MTTKRNKLKILRGIKKLIDKPRKWIQGVYHLVTDENESYCLIGAKDEIIIKLIEHDKQWLAGKNIRKILIDTRPKEFKLVRNGILGINDSPRMNHQKMMRWLDRAIRKVENNEL